MKEAVAKIQRFRSRYVETFRLPNPVGRSIITFGFDDCPASAIHTALPMLEAEGWRATIYTAVGLCDTTNHLGLHMSQKDIVDIHDRGHEIADHTYSHVGTKDVSVEAYIADIDRNQAALTELGLPPSQHFAFPYGDVSPALKRRLRHRFKTLRGVLPMEAIDQDANLLPALRIYHGPDIDAAIDRILQTAEQPQWLNLFSHDVRDAPSAYGCSPHDLARIIDAAKQSGADVMTVDQAFQAIYEKREAA